MIVACHSNPISKVNFELKERLKKSTLGDGLYFILVNEQLSSVFQPIVDVNSQTVFAFEALTRGPISTPLFNPMNLFHAAQDHGCLLEMDLLARKTAITNFKKFDGPSLEECYLFLNVSVQTFMEREKPASGVTLECLQQLGLPAKRVVIEITELQPVDDYESFIESVHHYRELGFKVAIDDLGGGYNGLRLWSEVRPDFVKIDKHFISGVHLNEDKKCFIETIVTLAKSLNTRVIAEGVESERELKVLKNAGVDYVQGFLLKKPNPVPSLDLDYDWPEGLKSFNTEVTDPGSLEETVSMLMTKVPSIPPDFSVSYCSQVMLDDDSLDFLPVVKEGSKVKGIIWRKELMDRLARPYGQSLHFRKKVKEIMDDRPIVVDLRTPLVDFSRMVTDSTMNHRGNAFIITDQSKYVGVGTFNDLLKVMTDLKVQSAQHANPLSGLPGNVAIQNRLKQSLAEQQRFVVLYVDVDHFKPYNDYYSFEQGDDIIKAIAEVLLKYARSQTDFVGHVGGDDFMVISSDVKGYHQLVQNILHRFQQIIPDFYTEADRKKGGILAVNRDGEKQFFNMMSLSIGVLLVHPNKISHTQQLASFATKAKKGAKAAGGNTFYLVDTAELEDISQWLV